MTGSRLGGYSLGRDGRLLFATRFVRLFAYGFLAVVLVLYLSAAGIGDAQIGALLTLTLVGDTAISLWLSTHADRLGRKRMLVAGCALMLLAGIAFVLTKSFLVLLIAATVGVISPGGNEVGPFLAIEQAALAHLVPDGRRTAVFGYYNLIGSVATALGSLSGGAVAQLLLSHGLTQVASYRVVILGYALFGALLGMMFIALSRNVEVSGVGMMRGAPAAANAAADTTGAGSPAPEGASPATTAASPASAAPDATASANAPTSGASPGTVGPNTSARPTSTNLSPRKALLGLHESRGIVARLSALFSLDAFGGGLVTQSIVVYWFHLRFGSPPAILGAIFFCANILAGLSALVATRLAGRFGYVNTMVFTHMPSNLLLILVPFMPTLQLAILVLLLRFTISQMDVPTRQAYTMAVVGPAERSAAAGITGVARTAGSALSPLVSLPLLSLFLSAPFVIAGTLKLIYDLLLLRSSRATLTVGATKPAG